MQGGKEGGKGEEGKWRESGRGREEEEDRQGREKELREGKKKPGENACFTYLSVTMTWCIYQLYIKIRDVKRPD